MVVVGEVEIFYEGDLVTRKEAVEQGLKNYFTGKPCKYGHVETRQTCSGQCNQCKRLRTQKWREKPESEKYQNEKVSKELPSQEDLLDAFGYNFETGHLYWKEKTVHTHHDRAWNTQYSGKVAGSKHYANGYIEVRFFDGKLYKGHQLIWKLVTGEDPILPIDHKNQKPWDNSWNNLRLATNQENARNSKTSSITGYKGVTMDKSCWKACWCVGDINYSQSGFSTPKSAAKFYDKIVRDLYGDFAELNFPEDKEENISE